MLYLRLDEVRLKDRHLGEDALRRQRMAPGSLRLRIRLDRPLRLLPDPLLPEVRKYGSAPRTSFSMQGTTDKMTE